MTEEEEEEGRYGLNSLGKRVVAFAAVYNRYTIQSVSQPVSSRLWNLPVKRASRPVDEKTITYFSGTIVDAPTYIYPSFILSLTRQRDREIAFS